MKTFKSNYFLRLLNFNLHPLISKLMRTILLFLIATTTLSCNEQACAEMRDWFSSYEEAVAAMYLQCLSYFS